MTGHSPLVKKIYHIQAGNTDQYKTVQNVIAFPGIRQPFSVYIAAINFALNIVHSTSLLFHRYSIKWHFIIDQKIKLVGEMMFFTSLEGE